MTVNSTMLESEHDDFFCISWAPAAGFVLQSGLFTKFWR
jgi:hypothetical protein